MDLNVAHIKGDLFALEARDGSSQVIKKSFFIVFFDTYICNHLILKLGPVLVFPVYLPYIFFAWILF